MDKEKQYNKLLKQIEEHLDSDIDKLIDTGDFSDSDKSVSEFDENAIFHQIMDEITIKEQHSFRRVVKWISAAVVIFMLGFGSYHCMSQSSIEYQEICAAKGEKLLIVLPDGTKVNLNADSKLRFPNRFFGKSRNVTLEGEGYFSVAKDTKHPFVVKAYDMMVKVTGTKFNLKAYPESRHIITTLEEGKVMVGKYSDENYLLSLNPQQESNFDRETSLCKVYSVGSDHVASDWKDNELSFKNATMKEVILVLERNFNINIIVKNPQVMKYSYNFTCSSYNIDGVIEIMETITPVKIKHSKTHTYIIN